jgi:alcohol dehydrogenase (cytochrome c)
MRTVVARLALAAAAAALLSGCGSHVRPGTWPLPGADLAGTRAATGSTITARNAGELRPRWSFAFRPTRGRAGIYASTPVVDANFVFVEDLRSNVFALDRRTGKVQWAHHYDAPNGGPNGLAVDGGRVYGATAEEVFALAELNGRELWSRRLTSATTQLIDVAPVPWQGLLFVSTIGEAPGGRGAIYALDAATGKVRWRFDTIAHPRLAGGGGAWYPVSVDTQGRLYAGTASPIPSGGSPYTDSLVVLDAATGRLLWDRQVTAHGMRDDDFEATPIVAGTSVFGAGRSGRVVAWSTTTHKRRWERAVGVHHDGLGPLPGRPTEICPGPFGGVETPAAYAAGRLFVPVVDLCTRGGATTRERTTPLDPLKGRGRLVALSASTGRILWQRSLGAPDFGCAAAANDVVFTSSYDGTAYAFDTRSGALLWHARLPAGSNACPAVAGDMLYLGAGVELTGSRPELVAYGLPR